MSVFFVGITAQPKKREKKQDFVSELLDLRCTSATKANVVTYHMFFGRVCNQNHRTVES